MKKTALLNSSLSQLIATMGHTDGLTICDAGLPIPAAQQTVDLALTAGVPDFMTTLKTVLKELFVERVVLAEEIKQYNPLILQQVTDLFAETAEQQGKPIAIEFIPHQQFKAQSNQAKGVVRSGECSPYANVILYSGVPF
ncbi:D-ribose pyranase [Pasteurellaceae bacterium Macca]|nr:D-ribose pyranase [Pasteurellaceae bacterium Macca]